MHGYPLSAYLVAHSSDMKAVHQIIDEPSFNPNAIIDEYGRTALHCAVRVYLHECPARKSIVIKLLEKGAKPNIQDDYGYTALHYASTANYKMFLVKLLLEAGADFTLCNNAEERPIDIAYRKYAGAIVELLETHIEMSKTTLHIHKPEEELSKPLARPLASIDTLTGSLSSMLTPITPIPTPSEFNQFIAVTPFCLQSSLRSAKARAETSDTIPDSDDIAPYSS